ncbi:hypothetical protein GOP47_0007877 [Adiantum capillus-veneris]|uniref:Uncharacterized protein n=1 Tax=Adiantum capillus-veneris TaxID=13818 RepID=A0A9D4ZJN2_ADICA|nr:hypothetical protein GOP47_0007877 [Adiantum capillus-veneris]
MEGRIQQLPGYKAQQPACRTKLPPQHRQRHRKVPHSGGDHLQELSSSLGPMQELSAFQETRAIILPVFYGVKPSELASHNSDTRVAEWRQLHPHLTDKTAIRWITALDDIRSKSGYEIASSIGDVNSPKLQRRLLSDIRLLLAAQVLKEERVDSENLGWACEDIDEELSAKNHTAEHMENSAALLLKWNVIPYLVAHMKFLH